MKRRVLRWVVLSVVLGVIWPAGPVRSDESETEELRELMMRLHDSPETVETPDGAALPPVSVSPGETVYIYEPNWNFRVAGDCGKKVVCEGLVVYEDNAKIAFGSLLAATAAFGAGGVELTLYRDFTVDAEQGKPFNATVTLGGWAHGSLNTSAAFAGAARSEFSASWGADEYPRGRDLEPAGPLYPRPIFVETIRREACDSHGLGRKVAICPTPYVLEQASRTDVFRVEGGRTYRLWMTYRAGVSATAFAEASVDFRKNAAIGWLPLKITVNPDVSDSIEAIGSRLQRLETAVQAAGAQGSETWTTLAEMSLSLNEPLVGLYLPGSEGGQVEAVSRLVAQRIVQCEGLGQDVRQAKLFYQQADAALAAGRYREAMNWLGQAYRSLNVERRVAVVEGPPDPRPSGNLRGPEARYR